MLMRCFGSGFVCPMKSNVLWSFIMRKFVGFTGILSAIMAPVSIGFWLVGEIDLTQMVVFVLAFFGMAFLIMWELDHFECMD
jgi:hypothetical protein